MQCDPHVNSIVRAAKLASMYLCEHWEVKILDYYCENLDEEILECARQFKPTHVIWLGTCGGPFQPKKETFKKLKEHAKTVFLCPEASHPDWHLLIESLLECFTLVVNLDGLPGFEDDSGKGMTTLAIYDDLPYASQSAYPWEKRPISVGFCGGHGHDGTMRKAIVDYLLSVRQPSGVSLLTYFPFIEVTGTYQLYADFMMMSKIIINPAGSSSDLSKHVKGRVVECGLAGSVLLEEEGSPISLWFEEDCYYTYQDPLHAEQMVYHILNNPEEAKRRAQKLNAKVRSDYAPLKLWSQIFGILGK